MTAKTNKSTDLKLSPLAKTTKDKLPNIQVILIAIFCILVTIAYFLVMLLIQKGVYK